MEFDGLIFDMDGIIVDVSLSYREAIRRTAAYFLGRKVSMEEVSRIKNRIGMNNDWEATYALINNRNISFSDVKAHFQSQYWGTGQERGLITGEKLLISIRELKKLKEKYKKLGIATGRPKKEADYVIINNQLEGIFDCLVAMEDVGRGKPFPDCINKVIGILKLEKTVYIGDSPSDVQASEAAGIPCIYIGKEKLGTISYISVSRMMEDLL